MAESPRTTPRKRGEGQWALGYHEPLNPAERVKKDDDGLRVRVRIEEKYSKQGFRSIDKADLRSRFRWWGLYTQRKQGLPGGVTATAEPHELEDEYFMLREPHPRRPALERPAACGRPLLRVLRARRRRRHRPAERAAPLDPDEDVPAIWEELEAVGLSTQEACGDTPRVMIGCPLAGVDAGRRSMPHRHFWRRSVATSAYPAFSNLPRKFKTSMSGCRQQCAQHEVNDVAFVGVLHPELGAGFDLWVGGGLSTNPHIGQRVGVFVEPGLVPEVWAGVIGLFRDYGYRRARNHARLKFLVADKGAAWFREVLEGEYLGGPLPDGDAPPTSVDAHRDHVGVATQKDGRSYVGFASKAGRIPGHQLRKIADLADRYGQGRTRTTTQQKMVILDVEPDRVDDLVAALEDEDLSVHPSPFRKGLMACTGIEFCKLALTETKGRAIWLANELERRLPDFDEDIRIHVNGCPNSCARFQLADIGLMGAVQLRPDGTKSDTFLVHLGGGLGEVGAFTRKAKGIRIFAEDSADYVETLLVRYTHRRTDGQTFGAFVRGLSEAQLASFARWDR